MKGLLKVILTLSLLPTAPWANLTLYKLEDDLTSIKAIAWDSETGVAKITDRHNDSHEGMVTLTRKHSALENKTNIYIKYEESYYGEDAAEFIVFPDLYPVGENNFRVIGVSYILKGGEKFLST